MTNTFEEALKLKIAEVRAQLAEYERIPCFRLDIEIDGRVHDGEIAVEFKLTKDIYSSLTSACGGDLDAVVEEFLRRNHWASINAPMQLSYLPQGVPAQGITPEVVQDISTNDDEVPF